MSFLPKVPNVPVLLDVSPSRFTLARDAERWEYEAAAWVDGQGKVRGIGPAPVPGATPVPLFGPLPAGASEVDRSAVLAGFMTAAIGNAVAKAFFRLRPHVTVTGTASLAPILSGYERSILKQALIEAGAMSVTFA